MATASIRKDFVVADDDTCARLIKAMASPVDLDQFIDKKTIEKYENGKKSLKLFAGRYENKKSENIGPQHTSSVDNIEIASIDEVLILSKQFIERNKEAYTRLAK